MSELEGGPQQRPEIRIVVDDQDGERLLDSAHDIRSFCGLRERLRRGSRSLSPEPRGLLSLVDFGEPPEGD